MFTDPSATAFDTFCPMQSSPRFRTIEASDLDRVLEINAMNVPEVGAIDVAVDAILVATFNENIVLTDSGTVTIKDLDTPADTVINLPDAHRSPAYTLSLQHKLPARNRAIPQHGYGKHHNVP